MQYCDKKHISHLGVGALQISLPKEIIEPIATAQSPEEVVNVLNQLSQSQEGNQVVLAMFQAFQKSLTSKMFNGGKLKQLLDKCQKWK